MEVKKAVESMLVISGKKKQDIAKFLQISKPSFTNWLDKMDQIKRFIKICNYCGFTVIITDKKSLLFFEYLIY